MFITFISTIDIWVYVGDIQLEVEGWGIVEVSIFNDNGIFKINLFKMVYISIFYISLVAVSKVFDVKYN